MSDEPTAEAVPPATADPPPLPTPDAATAAAAARLGVSADDLALIEAEHGVLEAGGLLKVAVREYAALLGRRRLSDLRGRVDWIGYDVEQGPAERDAAAADAGPALAAAA